MTAFWSGLCAGEIRIELYVVRGLYIQYTRDTSTPEPNLYPHPPETSSIISIGFGFLIARIYDLITANYLRIFRWKCFCVGRGKGKVDEAGGEQSPPYLYPLFSPIFTHQILPQSHTSSHLPDRIGNPETITLGQQILTRVRIMRVCGSYYGECLLESQTRQSDTWCEKKCW